MKVVNVLKSQYLAVNLRTTNGSLQTSTDKLWNDLIQIERSSVLVKRDIPLVYSYKPFVHRKSKREFIYHISYACSICHCTSFSPKGTVLITSGACIANVNGPKMSS